MLTCIELIGENNNNSYLSVSHKSQGMWANGLLLLVGAYSMPMGKLQLCVGQSIVVEPVITYFILVWE